MKADEIKWDKRYSHKDYPTKPVELVTEFYKLAKKGRALDIAAGNGRNSLFLAKKGFEVDSVDVSGVGLENIRKKDSSINIIHADLDTYQLKHDYYDLIVNVNFLQRRLYPYIRDALKMGGILLFQTFLEKSRNDPAYSATKRDQFLKRNELLHVFLSFYVILYNEKEVVFPNNEQQEIAMLIARKNKDD